MNKIVQMHIGLIMLLITYLISGIERTVRVYLECLILNCGTHGSVIIDVVRPVTHRSLILESHVLRGRLMFCACP